MKQNRYLSYLAMIVMCGLMWACNSTRHLPKDEVLYTGAKVNVHHPPDDGKKKKDLRDELESLVRPRPNKKFLGMRIKLFIYNIAGKPKRENSLLGKLKYRTGEPPVLLSSLNLEYNTRVLTSNLGNQGYFHAKVKGDTVIRNRKAKAIFDVETGPRYTIREVYFETDSSLLSRQIKETVNGTFLKAGDHYNLETIKAERIRIDVVLKESGYYYFNPDYLIINADSTIGNNQVNLYVKVKPETPQKARLPYTIRDVYIFTNYSLRGQNEDTLKNRAVVFNGNHIVDRRNLYKPRMFDKMILFDKGDLYKRTDHNLTINRLISLGLFKFVKNRFEDADSAGVPALDSYYYLTPFPKKSLRVELDASSKSNNLVGSNLGISWRNRNTFRSGELLTITASGGFELQYSGQFRGYNTFRGGLEANLSIPRFIVPFLDLNTSSGFVPKTNMMIAYDILNKQKLYTMNSLRATYGYLWKESIRKEHQLNILSFNFVQPIAITQEFTDSSKNNPTLQKAVEKQFIIGSTYSFTYSPFTGAINSSGIYFNGTLDLSGNIAGLLSGADAKAGKTSKLFNAVFSQYIKAQADLRYYLKTGNNAFWVNRLIAGYGLPYGNSTALPFIKQFFSGGNNSLRAFRSRSVGPGTYLPANYGKNNFYAEQSGDIKLEFNSEFRARLFSIVHGAAFVDAGNIWLKNEDPLKPGARFSSDFMKEIAVGAGLGIRLDISFLVLRFDVAFPLRKPWLPEGQRWVLDQIRLGDKAWRSENLVYNLAIGYPF